MIRNEERPEACVGIELDLVVAMTATVAAVSMVVETLSAGAAGNDAQLLRDAQRLFKPLPKDAATAEFPITPERVELGRRLFFDPRISADGTVSCERGQQPALNGRLPKARGGLARLNDRNGAHGAQRCVSVQSSLARGPSER